MHSASCEQSRQRTNRSNRSTKNKEHSGAKSSSARRAPSNHTPRRLTNPRMTNVKHGSCFMYPGTVTTENPLLEDRVHRSPPVWLRTSRCFRQEVSSLQLLPKSLIIRHGVTRGLTPLREAPLNPHERSPDLPVFQHIVSSNILPTLSTLTIIHIPLSAISDCTTPKPGAVLPESTFGSNPNSRCIA